RRRGGVVVVDLPRRVDDAVAEALAQVDVGLLIVPAELRAVAAAQRVATGVRPVLGDLRAVARGVPGPDPGLPPDEIARLLKLPLAGELGWDTGLVGDLARDVPPGAQPRGPLARFCTEFWRRVPVPSGPPPRQPGPGVGG